MVFTSADCSPPFSSRTNLLYLMVLAFWEEVSRYGCSEHLRLLQDTGCREGPLPTPQRDNPEILKWEKPPNSTLNLWQKPNGKVRIKGKRDGERQCALTVKVRNARDRCTQRGQDATGRGELGCHSRSTMRSEEKGLQQILLRHLQTEHGPVDNWILDG